jgi:hypothetical protein
MKSKPFNRARYERAGDLSGLFDLRMLGRAGKD